MIIDKNENTTVVSNESLDLPTFMNSSKWRICFI